MRYWSSAISSKFRTQFVKANINVRQTKQFNDYKFSKKIPHHYLRRIINAIGTIDGYDLLICALSENEGLDMYDDRLTKTSLSVKLIVISSALYFSSFKRNDRFEKNNSIIYTLTNYSRDILLNDCNANDKLIKVYDKCVTLLYRNWYRITSISQSSHIWTSNDWDKFILNGEMFLLPWFALCHIKTILGKPILTDWQNNFHFNFVSMMKAEEELFLWKENILSKKPCFVLSLVTSKYSGRIALNDVAKFVYLSPECGWLLSKLENSIFWITSNLPSEVGEEIAAIITDTAMRAKITVNKFKKIRRELME